MAYAPKWDRDAGREMWAAGKSDKEIAAVYGVHPSNVGQVRRKYWETEAKPVNCQENTTAEPAKSRENTTATSDPGEIFRAIESIVRDLDGMAAVVTAQAVIALRQGDLNTARAAINWLIEKERAEA